MTSSAGSTSAGGTGGTGAGSQGARGAGASAPAAYRTRAVRALGHRFEVETADHGLGAYVDALFAAMPPAGSGAGVLRYRVVEHGGPGWELLGGQRSIVRTDTPSDVLAMLLWDVNRSVVERTDGLLLLHAAAAERDGVAVVLPGAMEAGKTTLVAALVRAGLRYLTDEVTAVDTAADRIEPYPKALSVDPGSWPLLGDLSPAVPEAARRFQPDQWQVIPTSIRPDAVAPGARPRLVVLPRYLPGAATELRPLTRADALVAVAGCCFRFEDDPGGTIDGLARMLGACETYELVHSDLDAAVGAVLAALDRRVEAAGTASAGTEEPGSPTDNLGRPDRAHGGSTAGTDTGGESMARAATPDEVGLDFAPRRHAGITGVELDGEMVLYSGDGEMHKLDPVATVLWNCFDGSVTLAELADDLDTVFDGTEPSRIRDDVVACVRELGRQGLLANVVAPDGGGGAA